MATMSQSDVSLPVMLVWSETTHPRSDTPNLVMASTEDSRPTPALVLRYVSLVINKIKERPLLFVFGGHAPVLSEKLIDFCTSQRVTFYCVPKEATK